MLSDEELEEIVSGPSMGPPLKAAENHTDSARAHIEEIHLQWGRR